VISSQRHYYKVKLDTLERTETHEQCLQKEKELRAQISFLEDEVSTLTYKLESQATTDIISTKDDQDERRYNTDENMHIDGLGLEWIVA